MKQFLATCSPPNLHPARQYERGLGKYDSQGCMRLIRQLGERLKTQAVKKSSCHASSLRGSLPTVI
jgi:hypothetical protein